MRPTHHQEGSAGHRSVQHPVPLTEFAHALPPQCRSISLTAQRPRRGSAAHQPAVRTPVSRAVGSGSRDGSRETVHTSRSGRARDGQHIIAESMRAASLPLYIWAVARAAGPSLQFRTGYATQRAIAPRPPRTRPSEKTLLHLSILRRDSSSGTLACARLGQRQGPPGGQVPGLPAGIRRSSSRGATN